MRQHVNAQATQDNEGDVTPAVTPPTVLAREGHHGPVVHATNTPADALNIRPGARIVDVQAIHRGLHVAEADLEGDAAFLKRLSFWSRRWCPWTVEDGIDGLFLDTAGSAHLFGGEIALLSDIEKQFDALSLTARTALAPTPRAAHALARYGPRAAIATAETLAAVLAPLPVEALQLPVKTVRLMDRLGLRTIGLLAGMPRIGLMRRFIKVAEEENPLILLDLTHGRRADPLSAPADAKHYLIRSRLAEPVMDPEPHLPDLARRLCRDLARNGHGARVLQLCIYRIDGERRTARLSTARATCEVSHMVRLLTGRLEGIDPGFGFDLLTLEALRTEPMRQVQTHLHGERDRDADIARLIDRLTAQFGKERITWSHWVESHLPERVEERVPAIDNAPVHRPAEPPRRQLAAIAQRPIRLLDPPEEVSVIYLAPDGPPARFTWRRRPFTVTRRSGPERIAPEWWRARPGTRLRDYYKVEVQDGQRIWLYREGLAGDRRGDEPRWFVHGFFA